MVTAGLSDVGKDAGVGASAGRVSWVVLVYRVPREPSSPRIAIWRRLKALGVGQLGDGVVALPEDARTREHLEWIADRAQDAGGTALMLRAQAMSQRDETTIATQMAAARAQEYRDLTNRARQALTDIPETGEVDRRLLQRLRTDLRAITRRDYFPPVERDEATTAVRDLTPPATHEPATHEPGTAGHSASATGGRS